MVGKYVLLVEIFNTEEGIEDIILSNHNDKAMQHSIISSNYKKITDIELSDELGCITLVMIDKDGIDKLDVPLDEEITLYDPN